MQSGARAVSHASRSMVPTEFIQFNKGSLEEK